jgi:ribonuclease HII
LTQRARKVRPDFTLEMRAVKRGMTPVVGVDEAGRGPWAGPVVAAAAWLDPSGLSNSLRDALDDSKKLTPERRAHLLEEMSTTDAVTFAVGWASVREIDRINILAASLLAMQRAVEFLPFEPGHALVDGNRLPTLTCSGEAVVKGDGRSLSIAAASIVAKVTRDREMARLARAHPGYGWESNKGYGTADHARALAALGPSEHHRRSFRPVAQALEA